MAEFTLEVEDSEVGDGLVIKFSAKGFPSNKEEALAQSDGAFSIYLLFDIVFRLIYDEDLTDKDEDF